MNKLEADIICKELNDAEYPSHFIVEFCCDDCKLTCDKENSSCFEVTLI